MVKYATWSILHEDTVLARLEIIFFFPFIVNALNDYTLEKEMPAYVIDISQVKDLKSGRNTAVGYPPPLLRGRQLLRGRRITVLSGEHSLAIRW
jgi:hypothetical protein